MVRLSCRAMASYSVGGLLADVHHQSLHLLCEAFGSHYQGLGIAARHALRSRSVCQRTVKKVVQLDLAFAYARRITAQRVHEFALVLQEELLRGSSFQDEHTHNILNDGGGGLRCGMSEDDTRQCMHLMSLEVAGANSCG